MQRSWWKWSNLSIPPQYDLPSAWLNRTPYFWVWWILQPVASLSYFYAQCKDGKSDHHEGFQTKQESRKKKDPYTHVRFSLLLVYQILYHSSTCCAPRVYRYKSCFMQTAILRNGSFLHVNSKFWRFCRKYYLNVSQPLNAIILS